MPEISNSMVLELTLKNKGLVSIYNKSCDFDLLEIKDKLDKHFMDDNQYKRLHIVYKDIIDHLVKISYSNFELRKRKKENIIIQDLYNINQLTLAEKISKIPFPIDKFDYYYNSSYRFFTFNGAWEACSNRRDRMESESSSFLNNYSTDITKHIIQHYIKTVTTYLLNVDKIIRKHKVECKKSAIHIQLNNFEIVLNPNCLTLTQKDSEILKDYLLKLFSDVNVPRLSVGLRDYDIKDNGEMLFLKSYKYDIYKSHIQESLQMLADDIWKQYLIEIQNDEILTKFIESITHWLKEEVLSQS